MTAWLLLLALDGCRDWPDYEGAFDVPTAIGVLQPEVGGPFQEPIGFVGNQHGGQISLLALKQGRFLTDDPTAAFLRANPLPTGQRRVLAGLLPYAHPDGRVTVFAFDNAFGQLLEVPYVIGFDAAGFPIEAPATVSEPTFEDVDGSGDQPQLVDIEVKSGWTTTETWTVTFDGEVWHTTGSRSGDMPGEARPGEPFVGVDRTLAFTVEGEATAGDRFTLQTDSGLIEHDLDARVMEVRMAPDQALGSVILVPNDATDSELRLFDPTAPGDFSTALPVALPAGASPTRAAWDHTGTHLFVGDRNLSAVWHLSWSDPSDRSTYTVETLPLPWPVADVAPLLNEDGAQLFVTPLEQAELWSYDLEAGTLRDADPWRPGAQGIRFDNPIRGIEALPIPYRQLETDDLGHRDFGRGVAVSLAAGAVVFGDERTACLVADRFGPQTGLTSQYASTLDFTRTFEGEAPYGATLARNDANVRHVLANPCPGITRTQTWNLEYDALQQGWRVTGTLSGEQASLAHEDERYISDDGEISFRILSGQTPSRDGWRISFRMTEGLTKADGDQDDDGRLLEIPMDSPTDPIYFHYEVGPRNGGWYPVDDRPYVLVGAASLDIVGRVDPQDGLIDASWD